MDLIRELPLTNKGRVLRKSIAFDGGAGTGAQGAITLFSVTGTVRAFVTAFCTENLAGATATIEVGISGATATVIAQTTATDIDAGEVWHDASPDASIEADSVSGGHIITNGADIIATIATADISDGELTFVCEWEPLSADGEVAVG
jgi:hypothetical protein